MMLGKPGPGHHGLGASLLSTGRPRPLVSVLLLSMLCVVTFYYINTASRIATRTDPKYEVLYAASEMSESRPRGRREPTILPEQYEVLKHQLEAMQEEVKLYEDEVPRAFFPTKIDTPFLGTIEDTHQVVNRECPRYVTMGKPQHGLGHQMGTFTTTLITALYFNLTLVDSGFRDDSWHGEYPGIGKFTGLSHQELQLEEVEKTVSRVIDVDSMPVEPFSDDLRTLYEPLRKTFVDEYGQECNVLFRLREYYSYDYGSSTKWILASKFQDAPERSPIPLLYEPEHFIIALHIRVGDISPTPPSFFLRVLSAVVPRLVEQQVPYRIHVFAENKGADDFPDLLQAYRGRIAFHADLSPFDSFYHLTQPHVLVMSASGFSQFSALAGTKALQFSPPSRELFPLKFCPPTAVCCDKEGNFDAAGALRVQWRIQRWKQAQRLRSSIQQLAQVMASVRVAPSSSSTDEEAGEPPGADITLLPE